MRSICIVLAGGLGTRLRSAVPDLPKCLAPISNQPFLFWLLNSLAQRGVEHFLLALGHGANNVVKALNEPWASCLSVETVIERELLGTGGAVRNAMDEFRLDEALIVNGDSFLGGSLSAMLTPLNLAGGELMRIATVKVLDRARFGGIELDAAHHVTAFLEKGQSGSGLINAGLYRLHRSALDFWGPGPFSIETQLLPFLVRRRAVYSAELSGPFIDIGIPVDYHLFDTHFRDYINKS